MKKIIALALVLSVLAALSVGASAAGPDVRKNAVAEFYSVEGAYTDSVGNYNYYNYHVPVLTADTPAAREINREIEKRFGEKVEAQLKNMNSGYSLWMWELNWHAYWVGNQLFLMVYAELEADCRDYAAYGYDYEKQCRVTNEMILEQLGVTEEDYLENLREKVQFMFEDMWRIVAQKDRERVGYDRELEKTLSWADMDAPMYLDGFGEIVTIVKIASVAGAGWYYYLATPYSYG